MAICYENYKRFSKRQGFIGPMCRTLGSIAKTKRWFATDCEKCKATLVGKMIISRHSDVGVIEKVTSDDVLVTFKADEYSLLVNFKDLDNDWTLMPPISEIFGEVEQ